VRLSTVRLESDGGRDPLITRTVHGTIRGKFIELTERLGLADGQEVEIEVKAVEPPRQWGAGILGTAGALADDMYWDAIMEEVHQARKAQRRSQGEFE
jgi:hypothetical protein